MYTSATNNSAIENLVGYLLTRKAPLKIFQTKSQKTTFIDLERQAYLKAYGNNALAFSALQKGMAYFDIPGIGFIAYMEKWGNRYVLSNPVCRKADWETMTQAFIKICQEDGKKIVYMQVSEDFADMLHKKFGYFATQMGIESFVDLREWNLKGKKKQILRTSRNQALKRNILISEEEPQEALETLNHEWLKSRRLNRKEIRFLVRPMSMEKEGTRKFFAYAEGKLIGLIYFDPVYENGEVAGYVPNISRFSAKFKQGIFYAIMIHAMDVFKNEGVKTLYLGLTSNVVDDTYKDYELKYLKDIFRFTYEHGNNIYNYKGVNFTKTRFDGTEQKVYCASTSRLPLIAFLGLYKICNFI